MMFWSIAPGELLRITRQRPLLRQFIAIYGDWERMVLVDAQSNPVLRDLYILPFDDHSDLDATAMPDVDAPVINVYQDLGSHCVS
jgi:hypothetical protein